MEEIQKLTLEQEVFQALGEASMSWSETPKGIFDSTNAKRIGDELMKKINSDVPNAVNSLTKALKEDKEFFYAYQANIAMQFKDEFHRIAGKPGEVIHVNSDDVHEIANTAAINFLNLLCSQ